MADTFGTHLTFCLSTCLSAYSADIGLIGLAVMGQNLILNMNGTCFRPLDRWRRTQAFAPAS